MNWVPSGLGFYGRALRLPWEAGGRQEVGDWDSHHLCVLLLSVLHNWDLE